MGLPKLLGRAIFSSAEVTFARESRKVSTAAVLGATGAAHARRLGQIQNRREVPVARSWVVGLAVII